MMVLMAVVTTIMTTPALAVIYPPERLRAELLAPEAETAGTRCWYLWRWPARGRSHRDGRRLGRGGDPRIYALHLAHPLERGVLGTRALSASSAEPEALAPLLEHAHTARVRRTSDDARQSDPRGDICDVARVKGAALIIMGWHKPVFNQAVLGGTVQQVMKGSAADVAGLH